MTLKGKTNHYNVKLLRGYGISINLKDNRIILKNGQNDITGKSETEEHFVTRMPYEKIVMSGKGYVSTEALSLLSQHNRNLILVDTYGRATTYLNLFLSRSYPVIPEHMSPSTWELYPPTCDLILPRGIILQITLGMR